MNDERARARAVQVEQRLKSGKLTDGHFSVFGRLRTSQVAAVAAALVGSNPNNELERHDALRRALQLHETLHPALFRTNAEVSAELNQARHNEQKKIVVRDVTTTLLAKLSPIDKLNFANTGSLPDRYVLKVPNESE